MVSVAIPQPVIEEIIEHAKEDYPNEACGIVAGKDFASSHIYRMTNTEKSPVSYFMEPKEQFMVSKEIRNRKEQMLAIYHSHPDSEAFPSAKDVQLAFYPDSLYIIVSLVKKEPVVKAFSIKEGDIKEILVKTL